MPVAGRKPPAAPPIAPSAGGHRWLILVHQLPSTPATLRVRTWRRLQQLGALPVKQAVYVLPDTPAAREDFEWIRTEITASGGEATVFAADGVDSWSDDALVEEFRRARENAYAGLARDIEKVLRRLASKRRRRGTRAPAIGRLRGVFAERLAAIEQIDFFGTSGRDRVALLLKALDEKAAGPRPPDVPADRQDVARYADRLWVTRPRPGVDRMASAWLITRFVDPAARFGFAADRASVPADALPFDMFGVAFSHQGDRCTYETLCGVFAIDEPAVARIGTIVHDLDFKDARFEAPEAATIGMVIDGLQSAHPDDDVLLKHGMALFDALYRTFARLAPPPASRAATRARTLARRKRK